jgi:hypothetical protein
VLAGLDVDLRERAAGLEVQVEVDACLDVAAARDRRLDDAFIRCDDLRRGARRAGRGPDLGRRKSCDDNCRYR